MRCRFSIAFTLYYKVVIPKNFSYFIKLIIFSVTHYVRSIMWLKNLCLQQEALIIGIYSIPLIKTQRADYLEQKQVLCADRLFIRDYVYNGIF